MNVQRLLVVVLVVGLCVAVQTQGQTQASAPSKATRIEYAAPYAAMSVTTRAVLTDGQQSTPLVFAENSASINTPLHFIQEYRTNSVVVVTGMSVSVEALSVVRVTAMPPAECRREPEQVSWRVVVTLRDSSGVSLRRASADMQCDARNLFDTVMASTQRIDLTPYTGRTVYLEIAAMPERCFPVDAHRVAVLDCTETQPLQTIK